MATITKKELIDRIAAGENPTRAKLKQVDVTGVEPMAHAAPVFNVWREDVAQPGLSVEQALRNAPAQRQNMVVVPKVVE